MHEMHGPRRVETRDAASSRIIIMRRNARVVPQSTMSFNQIGARGPFASWAGA